MNRWLLISGGFVSAALLTASLAFGQAVQPKAAGDCKKGAPEQVSGQVVDITKDGKMTVRDDKGQTHQFQVSQDMAKSMKPGDKIDAKLSEGQKC
jgi:translation initiation factor IF-1